MGKPREVLALAAAAVPALLLYFSAAAAGGQGAGRIQGKTGDDPVGRLTGKYNRLLKDPGASSGRSGWFSWCHGVGARYRRLYVPVQTIGRKGGTKEVIILISIWCYPSTVIHA